MSRFDRNGDHAPKARRELGRKLLLACELERKAGEEVDRLVSIGIEVGFSDADLARLSGLTVGAISQRRRKPLFCRGCSVPMGYPGRGRPRERCESCGGAA